ncbi:MAG TPA: hypothetical protein DD670_13440, partial [Planctomycetaceae bacterium]|nr:hypothetical protein [Planctomycetaceae bacterium]
MANDINQTPEEGDEPELSLSGLSKAFAEALARGTDEDASEQATSSAEPRAQEPPERQTIDATDRHPFDEPSEEDEAGVESEGDDSSHACPINPRTILEAMLFVGDSENQPLETAKAAELMRGVEAHDIPALVDELNEAYRRDGCPYRIESVGAGYRLVLEEKYHA